MNKLNKTTILAMHSLFNPVLVGAVVTRSDDNNKLTVRAINEDVLYKSKNLGVYWYETSDDILKIGKVETKLATKKRDGTFGRGGSSGRISGTFSDYTTKSTDERTKELLYEAAKNNDCKIYFIPANNIKPAKLELSAIVAFEWGTQRRPVGNPHRA